MPKCSIKVSLIRSKQNRSDTGKSDRCPPRRRLSGRQGIQVTSIGDNNELERARSAASQTRPLGGFARTFSQPPGEIVLSRPGDGRNLSHPDGSGPVLNSSESPRQIEENEQKNYGEPESYSASGLRGTSPPAEATSNIS
jgi:hypothetical protein